MPKTLTNEKFIIVESNSNLLRILGVNERITTRKNGNISFDSFIGKKFNIWYNQFNNDLVENKLESDLYTDEIKKHKCELSVKKENFKKNNKNKMLRMKELNPINLLEYCMRKSGKEINYINVPLFSYLNLFVNPRESILVYDTRKGVFLYGIFYRYFSDDSMLNVTSLSNNKHYLLNFQQNNLKITSVFTETNEFYDTFFILEECDFIKVLNFYNSKYFQVVIYARYYSDVIEIINYLKSNNHINIKTVDFFFREYQTNENVHPLIKERNCDGFIISAYKVNI